VRVQYTAGFDPIPDDIQEACLHLMLFLSVSRTINPLLSARKLGDYEERFKVPRTLQDGDVAAEHEMPAVCRQLLSSYRLVGI
jgi:hypothetical protein